ncbi:MAG: hypothetical protein R3336_10190 [Phycisphaeraceae bacterium]|nr:hypothetical protein [Phycisphaeraceae bacterium]
MMHEVEVLRAACCVAGLDKQVCEKERPLLEKIAERAGVGSASLTAMIERAERDQGFFEKQFEYLSADPDATIRLLLDIATSDGDLEDNQRVVIGFFADRLGMDPDRRDQLITAAEARDRDRK